MDPPREATKPPDFDFSDILDDFLLQESDLGEMDLHFEETLSTIVNSDDTSAKSTFVKCNTCLDSVPSEWVQTLSCQHVHCHGCLAANVRNCLDTKPFKAAKCCQVIPTRTIKMMDSILSEDELDAYDAKMTELTSPAMKIYCVGCGNPLVIGSRKRSGECQQCGVKTCKSCRLKTHKGKCDKSKLEEAHQSEELVYKLAKSKGWKACPNCGNVAQKSSGCNHMT